jgi:hypothetical protein
LAAQRHRPSTTTVQPSWYSMLSWRTSRASAGVGECVEVAATPSFVLTRDSRDRSGPVLELTSAQWHSLIQRIKDDEVVVD